MSITYNLAEDRLVFRFICSRCGSELPFRTKSVELIANHEWRVEAESNLICGACLQTGHNVSSLGVPR